MNQKWVFPGVTAALVLLFVVLGFPHKEAEQIEDGSYVTKTAGWPDHFARWSVDAGTRKTFYSSFSFGSLVFDLVLLAAPIAVTWVIMRHLRPPPEPTPNKLRGSRGAIPTRGPPGTTRPTRR